MRKNKYFYFLILMLLYFSDIFPQYNNTISAGIAPWIQKNSNIINTYSVKSNPHSTGYSYYPVGTTGSQLFKYNVGTPGITTLIGGTKPYLLGNGDYANPTGVWKYYVQDQNAPYTIYEVDTATGNLTGVGVPSNIKNGHKLTDMEWDHTTNYFYLVSSDTALTETQFYRMYWPTKDLTWIGSTVNSPAAIVAGGFNVNGTYFGIDLLTDALWKVKKSTGAWTMVGSLGYPVNYSQDAGFDRSDFSKMLWCASGGTVGLYEIDTANAGINLIGTFPYPQVLATCFVTGVGPQITVDKLLNTQNLTGPYVVNAVVTPGGAGISYTKLFWSRNNTVITDSLNMTNTGGNNWTASIPGNGSPAIYRYYGYTKDSMNRYAVSPLGAPNNLYSFFTLGADTIKPVITHNPLGNTYKILWPLAVSATVTDNFGLDSVWVRWRINSTTAKEFKLPLINGNTYTATFNSVNSDVVSGDTIFYRIIAQDNSSGHNRDSTTLFYFLITPDEYICIGNSASSIQAFPFNTSYYGNRTQMLWQASEIIGASGFTGQITKIGFEITRADEIPMNNFSIKMQNSLDTSITGFVENNWTTVYSGTYTVPALGWQYILLQNPFEWDGVSNLLVQICFENSTNNFYSSVRGGFINNAHRCAFEFHDLSSACTAFQSPSVVTYRPNICFRIETSLQIKNTTGYTATEYKLSQNYPNPFNPVTRIKFDIIKQGLVSLKIYDVLGKVVSELVNEVKSKGQYSIDYDASGLPSGIYFYKLDCNGYSETKRMILLK
jgi:hypothetical protein